MHALPNLITLQHSRFYFLLFVFGGIGVCPWATISNPDFFLYLHVLLTCPRVGEKISGNPNCVYLTSLVKCKKIPILYLWPISKGPVQFPILLLNYESYFKVKKQILKANQIYCLTSCMVFVKSASIYILQDQKVKKLVVFVSNFNPKQFTLYPWK